jgi:hypothetical protein
MKINPIDSIFVIFVASVLTGFLYIAYSVKKNEDSYISYIHCVNSDSSLAWEGNVKHWSFLHGIWTFYDAETNEKIKTNANCTLKMQTK